MVTADGGADVFWIPVTGAFGRVDGVDVVVATGFSTIFAVAIGIGVTVGGIFTCCICWVCIGF